MAIIVCYKQVEYKKRNETLYTLINTHVFQVKKDTEKVSLDGVKRIVFKDLNFVSGVGDLVKFDNEEWLVTSTNNIDIIKSCVVTQVNNHISFYKTQIPLTIPCIIQTNGANYLGMDDNKFIASPSGKYACICPDLGHITKSDLSLRFIINGSAYKIGGINNLSSGLIILELCDDVIHENDDLINGIAWNEGHHIIHDYAIEVLNGEEQTIQYGESLTLNVKVEDNGIVVNPTPALIFESSDGTVCTVNNSGVVLATNSSGNAIITVKLASNNTITKTIKIYATSEAQDNFNYIMSGNSQPDTFIKYNQTKTFTVTKYDNNNTVVPTQFSFDILGSTPSDKYLLTVLNDNQCIIKALGYPYVVTLRALDLNSGQFIDKQINLKSLI